MTLKKIILAFLAIICLLSTLSSTGHKLSAKAQTRVWTVDDNGPADFNKIQEAVNNASSGDTIFVHEGTYNESIEINKSVSLVGEDRDLTIVNGQDADFAISITADNVTVKSFTIKKESPRTTDSGIRLLSSGNTINHNKIVGIYTGIILYLFINNMVSDNIVLSSNDTGISLLFSTNNWFIGNTISNNQQGISVETSRNNWFIGNTISNNQQGMSLTGTSSFNFFYDNSFYDPVNLDRGLANTWSYGGEGNYWSNYSGHDLNGDGIGDEPYSLDVGNRDGSPLMGAFSTFNVVLARKTYDVTLISNSTVSDFKFDQGTETGNRIIRFNVAGKDGTVGFSRIVIPIGLMNYSLVLADGEEAVSMKLDISNRTHVYLYLTYSHTNQTIMVISSKTLNLYNELLDNFSKLQTDLHSLTEIYSNLLSNYDALLGNYSQLQQSYSELNASYHDHLVDYQSNLENFKSLMYIFAFSTAIFIITTIYLSKRLHAPAGKTFEDKK